MSFLEKRLQSVYQNAPIIPYHSKTKFILMSDCHRGQGNAADNFLQNQNVFYGALEYYYQNGFIYIELGDGDELWENRKIKPIIDIHSDAFWMLSNFYRENRLYMLYGNHDIVKKYSYTCKNYKSYYCESERKTINLFPDIQITEGIILENVENKERIFLVHGHQGDILNDTLWPVARFLVRYIWRSLELIGFLDPTGGGKSYRKKEKIEKKLSFYADKNEQIVIAGHTHRPFFSKPKEGLYFNEGSCVHPRCITGIEIENNEISLVKWAICTRIDRSLYVGREILEGPVCISDYYGKG